MGSRGPRPGCGGRPRSSTPKPNARGYKRVSVGPPSKGTQVYEHRAKTGVGKGAKGGDAKVVDHANRQRGDNSKSNLKVTTRAKNNANRAKKSRYKAD